MKIGCVLIPYITSHKQLELAYNSVESIRSQNCAIYYSFILPQKSVSRAWNMGINECLSNGCKYVVVSNLDIRAHQGCIKALVDYMEQHKPIMVSPWCTQYTGKPHDFEVKRTTMTDNYSFFMVDKRLFEQIGEFDPNFEPAYLEDLDMQHRIELAKEKHMCVGNAKFDHYRSATIKHHKDKEWAKRELSYTKQFKYFEEKWGKPTGREENLWKTPFNINSKKEV